MGAFGQDCSLAASCLRLLVNALLILAAGMAVGQEQVPVDAMAAERQIFETVRAEVDARSAADARELIESSLQSDAIGNVERAQREAAMGLVLIECDPPDSAGSRAAFSRAFNLCEGVDARVRLAESFARLLYERGHYDETLALVNPGRFAGAEFSAERLAIEAIRGLALAALDRNAEAQEVFVTAFDSVVGSPLRESAPACDTARLIALNLSRLYRDEGRTEDATAVSRRLRAWLGEEDLVLR